MNELQTFESVIKTVSSIFNVSPDTIKPTSSPQNITNWDSLKHIELVMELERKFNVQFGAAEIPLLNSVQNICELLQNKI